MRSNLQVMNINLSFVLQILYLLQILEMDGLLKEQLLKDLVLLYTFLKEEHTCLNEKRILDSSCTFLSSSSISYSNVLNMEKTLSIDFDEDGKLGIQISSVISNTKGVLFGRTQLSAYGIQNQNQGMNDAFLIYYQRKNSLMTRYLLPIK